MAKYRIDVYGRGSENEIIAVDDAHWSEVKSHFECCPEDALDFVQNEAYDLADCAGAVYKKYFAQQMESGKVDIVKVADDGSEEIVKTLSTEDDDLSIYGKLFTELDAAIISRLGKDNITKENVLSLLSDREFLSTVLPKELITDEVVECIISNVADEPDGEGVLEVDDYDAEGIRSVLSKITGFVHIGDNEPYLQNCVLTDCSGSFCYQSDVFEIDGDFEVEKLGLYKYEDWDIEVYAATHILYGNRILQLEMDNGPENGIQYYFSEKGNWTEIEEEYFDDEDEEL